MGPDVRRAHFTRKWSSPWLSPASIIYISSLVSLFIYSQPFSRLLNPSCGKDPSTRDRPGPQRRFCLHSVGEFIWRIHTCHENCPISSHSHTYVTDLAPVYHPWKVSIWFCQRIYLQKQRNEQMPLKVLPNALILRLSFKIHTQPRSQFGSVIERRSAD